jgi:hypothetical protein
VFVLVERAYETGPFQSFQWFHSFNGSFKVPGSKFGSDKEILLKKLNCVNGHWMNRVVFHS